MLEAMDNKPVHARIGSRTYNVNGASDVVEAILKRLQNIDWLMVEKQNRMATLRRAKHAYLIDLREEIVRKKSGVDLSALLDGE